MTENEEREHVNNAAHQVVIAQLEDVEFIDVIEISGVYLDEQDLDLSVEDERGFFRAVRDEVARITKSILEEL